MKLRSVGFIRFFCFESVAQPRANAFIVALAVIGCLAMAPQDVKGAPPAGDQRPIVLTIDGFSLPATIQSPERIGSTPVYLRTQYLQPELQQSLPLSKALITWFEWDGDVFRTTEAVSSLQARIQKILADHGTRRIAIVTHSWGGVLAYLALRGLEQSRRIGLRSIDLLLTIHTPLAMPAGYLAAEAAIPRNVSAKRKAIVKTALLRFVGASVSPLTSVRQWTNYYSKEDQDWLSWPIAAAGGNIYSGRDHTTSYTDAEMQAQYAKAILDTAGGAIQQAGAVPPAAGTAASDLGGITWKAKGQQSGGLPDQPNVCERNEPLARRPGIPERNLIVEVWGLVPRSVDLMDTNVLRLAFETGRTFAKEHCGPLKHLQNVPRPPEMEDFKIMLYWGDWKSPMAWAEAIPLVGDPLVNWYGNRSFGSNAEVYRQYQLAAARAQAAAQQAKLAAEARAKKIGEFQKAVGCQWLERGQLVEFLRNPFLFKGKTLCFEVVDVEVMSESLALLYLADALPERVAAIGFPATKFTPTRGRLVFVGVADGLQQYPLFRFKALEPRRW